MLYICLFYYICIDLFLTFVSFPLQHLFILQHATKRSHFEYNIIISVWIYQQFIKIITSYKALIFCHNRNGDGASYSGANYGGTSSIGTGKGSGGNNGEGIGMLGMVFASGVDGSLQLCSIQFLPLILLLTLLCCCHPLWNSHWR
jgi:hypothetical protein